MGFAVLHSEKGGINANQIGRHIDRAKEVEHTYQHSDKEIDNYDFTPKKYQGMKLQEAIDLRIKEGYKGSKEIRKDAVKYVTHVLTGTHEDMKKIFEDIDRSNTWITDNYKFIAQEFGESNIVKFTLHLDEKTPHIHAVTVPLTDDGRLSAKERFGNASVLSERQDRYAIAMEKHGLERGFRNTGVKHETQKQYYGRINSIEDDKVIVKNNIEKQIEKFNITAMDIALGKADKKISDFKASLSNEIQKEVTLVGKKLIVENSALKKQIKETSKGVEDLRLDVQAKDVKSKVTVFEYMSSKCKSGELIFEGKKGHEIYFAYPNQRTGSISVNTQKNLFYDHQTGKGGDVIRACETIENKTFKEALVELNKGVDKSAVELYNQKPIRSGNEINDEIMITAVFDQVKHPALTNYMAERNLISSSMLKEVHWNIGDKQYFALGWKNDKGGFDVRNKAFKGKLGHNHFTAGSVNPSKNEPTGQRLFVFEGFTDYLSYRYENRAQNFDFVVLNSTSNVDKAIDFIKEKHQNKPISLLLDNDDAGTLATKRIQQSLPHAKDRRDVLERENFTANDYNDLSVKLKMEDKKDKIQKLTPKQGVKQALRKKDFGKDRGPSF